VYIGEMSTYIKSIEKNQRDYKSVANCLKNMSFFTKCSPTREKNKNGRKVKAGNYSNAKDS
jgi:hypothetical protein